MIFKPRRKEIRMERCVVCGAVTDVPFDRPVAERTRYVSGVGELCAACCRELYHVSDLREPSEPVSI